MNIYQIDTIGGQVIIVGDGKYFFPNKGKTDGDVDYESSTSHLVSSHESSVGLYGWTLSFIGTQIVTLIPFILTAANYSLLLGLSIYVLSTVFFLRIWSKKILIENKQRVLLRKLKQCVGKKDFCEASGLISEYT